MKIILNNNEEVFTEDRLSIQSLLNEKRFTFKMLVIKLNGRLVKKDQYETTIINDGDKVDVIHLISGG